MPATLGLSQSVLSNRPSRKGDRRQNSCSIYGKAINAKKSRMLTKTKDVRDMRLLLTFSGLIEHVSLTK